MPVNEKQIQAFWKKSKVYDKSKALRRGAKRFYFLDGPPYATGHIHVGTAFNKIVKDCYIRFWRMRGFDVWDQPGYDTHGLPIENKVEQKLGFKTKSQIEKFGIDKFNSRCRKFATEFIDVMNGEFADLGVWMDWPSPYLTLSNAYIESVWHTFKVGFEKGLLYKGLYPIHVCPRCETAVAYNEIIYNKVSDPSVFVKFKVKGSRNDFLVIWTTTPWTLPANTGIMVRPEAEYAKILIGGENLIMAKDLVETVTKKLGKEGKVTATMKGKELVGTKYIHPLAELLPYSKKIEQEDGYRVVPSERYVVLTDGSGLVHCAPGHGSEDFEVGKENKLPVVSPVTPAGKFDESAGMLAGKKVADGGELVLEELAKKSALLYQEKLVHDYPFCWRCESKLLLLARPQWFFKVTAIRGKLLAANDKVGWSPEWAKARFKNWLESLGDWPVSRQRYWGIPLPIWVCKKCEKIQVVGSADELPQKPEDLHRPFIDAVKLRCQCGGEMGRVPDVLDVWFDSGAASWASIGYPKNRQLFDDMWPAEINIEGPDQIRGWWNSQLIMSMISFDKAPFKKVLFHGFVLDAHGVKMSKSKGNIVTLEDLLKKNFTRDHLRFYMLSGAPWDDFYFNWKDMEAILKNFVIIENTFNFVKTYVPKVEKPGELKPEDRWILSRVNSLVREVTEHFESYNGHKAVTEIRDFVIDEFSRIYIKLVRDRVKPGTVDHAARYTLYTVSKTIARLMAPVVPFLAEHIHQDLLRPLGESLESVHLASWPLVDRSSMDADFEERMRIALKVAEYSNALRSKQRVKLRWPLRTLIVGGDEKVKAAVVTFADAIRQLTNVKDVSYGHAKWQAEQEGLKLFLDTELDAELKKEAAVREVIRKIQDLRKESKMVVTDRVVAYVSGADISGFEEEIKKEVGATKLVVGEIKARKKDRVEFEGQVIEVGIEPK
jgi:isoleucyl-tRNA synthetase